MRIFMRRARTRCGCSPSDWLSVTVAVYALRSTTVSSSRGMPSAINAAEPSTLSRPSKSSINFEKFSSYKLSAAYRVQFSIFVLPASKKKTTKHTTTQKQHKQKKEKNNKNQNFC